ncbi:MAG: formyltransferase family protein [Thalassotalea sp.]
MLSIGFAGNGWGASAAVRSLQKTFGHVNIFSEDKDVLKLARKTDVIVESLTLITDKYIVCAGYQDLISSQLLSKHVFINVHYSLLPQYRGMHSVVWGVLNGDKTFGYSVHIMDEFIDNGPIIYQHEFDVEEQTSTEIMTLLNMSVEKKLGHVVRDFLNGEIKVVEQKKSKATWVPKRNLDDCFINFEQMDLHFLNCMFRALVKPYPTPRIKMKDGIVELIEVLLIERDYFCTEGRVVNIDDEGVWVKIKGGLMLVKSCNFNEKQAQLNTIFKLGQRLQYV